MSTKLGLGLTVANSILLLIVFAIMPKTQDSPFSVSDGAGNSLLYVEDTGNVGIATDMPGSKLTVIGEIESTLGGIKFPDGTVQLSAASAGIPSGFIGLWSGTIANIPAGWALCDGTNGTPDLLARFVKGVSSAATDPGDTGGSATHNHDVGSFAVSAHNHGGATGAALGPNIHFDDNSGGTDFDEPAQRSHTHGISSQSGASVTGTSDPASSEPAFYALAFIMKL